VICWAIAFGASDMQTRMLDDRKLAILITMLSCIGQFLDALRPSRRLKQDHSLGYAFQPYRMHLQRRLRPWGFLCIRQRRRCEERDQVPMFKCPGVGFCIAGWTEELFHAGVSLRRLGSHDTNRGNFSCEYHHPLLLSWPCWAQPKHRHNRSI
jgi:hypothetical protein